MFLPVKKEMKSSTSKLFVKKKYKAIIFDIDGTLIPNRKDAMPSKKVIEAVGKAAKKINVGVATSRPYFLAKNIIEKLELTIPCVVTGGAQIFDPISNKYLLEHMLSKDDVLKIGEIADKVNIPMIIFDDGQDYHFDKNYIPGRPFQVWIHAIETSLAEKFIKKVSRIPTISILKVISWQKNKIDVIIANPSATKQHAISEIAKLLNIKTHQIIGVGDGYNDFPLLMACGFKIAMGNANEELKQIADYVAPSVEEDGVAHIVEKFIL